MPEQKRVWQDQQMNTESSGEEESLVGKMRSSVLDAEFEMSMKHSCATNQARGWRCRDELKGEVLR